MIENLVILPVRVGILMTKKCVESIRKQDIPVTLMCIDNGTDDGCGPWLRTFSDINVVYMQPRGLSYVWNCALSFAFDKLGLPFALLPNNDTVMRPDTYRLLIEDGGEFVSGVSVGSMDQMKEVNPTSKSPHPDFSLFLIRREVWQKIGKFDESMVTYASDCAYHVRMHRAGIEAYSISLPFYHERSSTLKWVDNETREAICKQADADREVFKNKYHCYPWEPAYEELFR